MKIKHLVISSCAACPFMTTSGEAHQRLARCEAIDDNRRNRLRYAEGSMMTPIAECPLDDYETEASPENVVREHVKGKAQRWKEYNDYRKEGNEQ